jgi:hypothetical protein
MAITADQNFQVRATFGRFNGEDTPISRVHNRFLPDVEVGKMHVASGFSSYDVFVRFNDASEYEAVRQALRNEGAEAVSDLISRRYDASSPLMAKG